jgi:hypothetical protein
VVACSPQFESIQAVVALRLKPCRKGSFMEDAMLDKNYPVPTYVNDSGFAIHLVRSHFKQLAIGASDTDLTDFGKEWEAERCGNVHNRDSGPCPITFNGGWNTRFDGNALRRRGHTIYVALYADCARTERHDYERGTIDHAVGERLFALVIHISSGKRKAYYLSCRKSVTSARYDGLNLIVEANDHVRKLKQNLLTRDTWEEQQWWSHPKTHIPGVARQVLHRTIDEVEALFGQGKDFFQPKKHPKRKRKSQLA